MADSPLAPHASTPAELQERLRAEREGEPFLVFRDDQGRQRLEQLEGRTGRVTIGRNPTNDVALIWDEEVSRLHAEIVRSGRDWSVSDDGLSLNGSFVNGEPIRGRRRLRDGDAVRVGATVLVFRNPRDGESSATTPSAELRTVVSLTPAQKRVLVSLCRPFKESAMFATPPTNDQIAGELYLSVDAVKKHLRALYEKFGVEHLPQNEKRARLVERAFAGGFISEREL